MAKLDFSGLDNAKCRELIEARPGGLFSLLEDECQVQIEATSKPPRSRREATSKPRRSHLEATLCH